MKRYRAPILLAVGVAALLTGCAKASTGQLATVPVQAGTFEAWIEAKGEAVPANSQLISGPEEVWGKIERILPEGSHVKAQEVVCRINIREIKRQYEMMRKNARTQQIEADKTQAQEPMRRGEIESELEVSRQANLEAAMDWETFKKGPQRDQAVQAGVDQAIAKLRFADSDLAQKRALFKRGLLSQEDLHLAELQDYQLRVATEKADLAARLLQPAAQPQLGATKRLHKEIADRMLAVKDQESHTRKDGLRFEIGELQTQAQAEQSEADDLARQVGLADIKAPIAGVLTYPKFWGRQKARVGLDVWPGFTFLSVAQLDKMKVVLQVPERDIARMRQGASVSIEIPGAFAPPLPGTVAEVAQAPKDQDSESKVFEVQVALSGPGKGLRANMKVKARILAERRAKALFVPQDALFYEHERPYVLVAGTKAGIRPGAKPRKVNVKAVAWSEDLVALEGALREGDRLYLLDPGDPLLAARDAEQPR